LRKTLIKKTIRGYLFILPWIIGFLIFRLYPLIFSFSLCFNEYSGIGPPEFIGFENWLQALKDNVFWKSLKVTGIYTAGAVPLTMIAGLSAALLLNQRLKGTYMFRLIYYIPSIITGVALAMIWRWMFHPEFGLINFFLHLLGIPGPHWLTSEIWVLPAFILMSLWGLGGNMIIYLAGLQGIPTVLYEAAEIDGANSFSKFWRITIPMLSPSIFFTLIMGVIGSFQVFTTAFVMTQGGPNNASMFTVLYIYRNAFEWLRMGYASVIAWILFFIIIILTYALFKSSGWVYYIGK